MAYSSAIPWNCHEFQHVVPDKALIMGGQNTTQLLAPEAATRTLLAHIADFLPRRGNGVRLWEPAALEAPPTPVISLPLFVLEASPDFGMSDLQNLEQPSGWRYVLADHQGAPMATADVMQSQDPGDDPAYLLAGLTIGSVAGELFDAVCIAMGHARKIDSGGGRLNPRLLDAPGANVSAVWLHGPEIELFTLMYPGEQPDKELIDSQHLLELVHEGSDHPVESGLAQ